MKKNIAIAACALTLCMAALVGCAQGAAPAGSEEGSAAVAEASAPIDEPAVATLSADVQIPDEVIASGAATELADGVYAMEVAFEGGSGRAQIESPAAVVVRDGHAAAQIVWSSPNYDYMIVDGTTYDQVNDDSGNSVFQIPIIAFDAPIPVIGDTTAMSSPHEIDYTFTFASNTAEAL